ncbi:MAG: hypothetical protein JWO26_219 [Rhodospirillales bacterium]|nr:hypothetical protein [Rhodospirillales bacterium]MDB5380587.1 hypothetical protein [Rhodospirillales bacterium]
MACRGTRQQGARPSPIPGENRRGLAMQRGARMARAGQDGDRRVPRKRPPAMPTRQLREVVGAEQQHEPRIAKPTPQRGQCIGGEAGAERPLDVGRDAAGRGGNRLRGGQAIRKWRHAEGRLQGISWRYHEPDLVQGERRQGSPGDMGMTGMRGIEAAPEQADAGVPCIAPGVRRTDRAAPFNSFHARVWSHSLCPTINGQG